MMEVKFVQGDDAIDVLLNSDEYLSKLSPFEMGVRMGDSNTKEVTPEEFRDHLSKQTLEWTIEEKDKVVDLFGQIESKLEIYDLKFPNPIKLIKTTGLDDIRDCSGYCRRHAIVMSQKTVDRDPDNLERFFMHELFHIQSQVSPELRYKLYALIGFEHCNEISIPKDLAEKKITNPDAQDLDVVINVTYNGEKIKCLPIILYDSKAPGNFFQRLRIKLLQVTQNLDGLYEYYKIDDEEGTDFNLISVEDTSDFSEQIGDSDYYFHPEEILATRFEELVRDNDLDNPYIKMLHDSL